jgi:hypothetical protein
VAMAQGVPGRGSIAWDALPRGAACAGLPANPKAEAIDVDAGGRGVGLR